MLMRTQTHTQRTARGVFSGGRVQLLMRAGARVVLCMRVSRWSMRERVELACGLRAAQRGSADVCVLSFESPGPSVRV